MSAPNNRDQKLILSQSEHFESVATEYISARKNSRFHQFQKTLWDHIVSSSELPLYFSKYGEIDVLEPMCGACDGIRLLRERLEVKISADAFDFSATMVEEAQKLHPDVHIFQQNVTSFSSEKKYDLIIIVGGLHHVYAHAEQVIASLSECLRANGLFVIIEPVNNNPVFRLIRDQIYKKNRAFDENSERAFTSAELDAYFSTAGLAPVFSTYPCLLAYVLWGCPEAFPALNRGSVGFVTRLLALEKFFWRSWPAKTFSFGMAAIYRKAQDSPGHTAGVEKFSGQT